MTDTSDIHELGTLHCAHCGWQITVAPDGGYVCPQCFHTETPSDG